MLPSRYWSELSIRDIRAHEMSGVIAVLPVAAVEQHGPHLPMGVDAIIMEACVERVALRLPPGLDAVFLPMQSIGVSLEHRDFPGTLSFSYETAARVIGDIAEGVVRAGVQKILLMNSHGGNSALISTAALDLRARFNV